VSAEAYDSFRTRSSQIPSRSSAYTYRMKAPFEFRRIRAVQRMAAEPDHDDSPDNGWICQDGGGKIGEAGDCHQYVPFPDQVLQKERKESIDLNALNIRAGSHSPSEPLHQVELEAHLIPLRRDHLLFFVACSGVPCSCMYFLITSMGAPPDDRII